MKRVLETGILILAIIASFSAFKQNEVLSMGKKAPLSDMPMLDVSGMEQSLNLLKREKGLLVIFSCNTCPFTLGWEDQYPDLEELTQKLDFGMVLVNSNEKERLGDESMKAMKEHFSAMNYKGAYLLDSKSRLADVFGAKTTPHVYLFDGEMELVYRGSIDDKYEHKSKEATKHYLKEAIEELGAGDEISNNDTREIGCSIKRI